jgi:hypothetical protein
MNGRRPQQLLLWALASLVGPLLGCEADCARPGCEALGQPAAPSGTGLAGVVAESSDLVVNGCSECGFGTAALQAWRVEAAMGSESEVATLMMMRAPDWEAQVSERYQHALPPGSYVLCVRPNCINLTIAEGQTRTANIKRRDGPTSFFVGGGDAARLAEDFGFEVGF